MQAQAIILEKHVIGPAWWQVTFAVAEFSGAFWPGQFFLLRCDPCYLRRPIFPQHLGDNRFALLLRPSPDPGLSWLISRQPGDALDVLGPLGRGFNLPAGAANLLLASDDQWLSPLLQQMELTVAAGGAVTLAQGGSRSAALYPVANLPAAVEFFAVTGDGSQGQRGQLANTLPQLLRWADAVLAVGSLELYRALKRHTEQVRLRVTPGFLFGLFAPELLPCGVGACFGCAVTGEHGLKLACSDGPIFDLAEIELG